MQKEEVYHQRRSRKVSAPAETTTSMKQAMQERERTSCEIATPTLSTVPSLQSLDEYVIKTDLGFDLHEEIIEEVLRKQGGDVKRVRRRGSAPARTLTETGIGTSKSFKQLRRKDFVGKSSRPTHLPELTLSTMPWLECFEEELEEDDFNPVEFNLNFLEDL